MTTPPAASQPSFEEQRRKGIGGSDAAAVAGVDPWRQPIDVYREKIGAAEERAPTPQMMRGKLLESVVVELYSKSKERSVRRRAQRAHPEYPFIIANIDRQILARENPGTDDQTDGTGLLEVKCPNVRMFQKYQREGLPAHIIVQGQHYLGVTGYKWMAFAIFNADLWKLVTFEIGREEDFIKRLFDVEVKFWREHVEKRVEPPPVTMAIAPPDFELPPVEGQIVHREDVEWAEAAESLKAAKDLFESAEMLKDQAIARVKELMGEHRVVEGADLRAYLMQSPGRVTFDKEALAKARPLDRNAVALIIAKWAEDLRAGEPIDVQNLLLRLGKDSELNLAPFNKQGKPFSTFRPYFLKPDVGEEE